MIGVRRLMKPKRLAELDADGRAPEARSRFDDL
jgi:hypothetical protein